MPSVELNDKEFDLIQKLRMPAEQRLEEIEQQRQLQRNLYLSRLPENQRLLQEKIEALSVWGQRAYFLMLRKAKIEEQLSLPEIQAGLQEALVLISPEKTS